MLVPIILLVRQVSLIQIRQLSKPINKDLLTLNNWLKADKISVHVKKIKLVIFRSRKLTIDHSSKLILDGKRLVPTKSVKYLRVQVEEHLH